MSDKALKEALGGAGNTYAVTVRRRPNHHCIVAFLPRLPRPVMFVASRRNPPRCSPHSCADSTSLLAASACLQTIWAGIMLIPLVFISGEYEKFGAFTKLWNENRYPPLRIKRLAAWSSYRALNATRPEAGGALDTS